MTECLKGTIMYNVRNERRIVGDRMSEKQKEALEKIMETIPMLSDFEKGRLLGHAEQMEEQRKKEHAENPKGSVA